MRLNYILSRHTGKPYKEVVQDTDRDNFMTAKQAKNYGIIDYVVDSRIVSNKI
jgi:ATP-dependent Clp protease protease subunit